MKTYKDIYNAVKNGKKIVIIHQPYGNKTTYFKNKKGQIRRKFNNCKDTYFYGSDVKIDSIDLRNLQIIN